MKKIIGFLILTLFLTTGCASNNPVPPANQDNSTAVDNSSVEKSTSSASNSGEVKQNKTMNNETIDPNKFEDLTSKYSGADIKTNFGNIKIKFYGKDSPITVNNFLNLAKLGFYDQTKFHRVIKDFMIQGGDPNSKDDDWSNDGTGGPDYRFQDEFNQHKLVLGSLAMANSGPNTNGSQFFIVTATSTPWLDGHHTNFGEITAGMDVVKKIEAVDKNQNDHPIKDVIVEGVELLK
jgi:cyclophilin family peptidyl-prolyl cis-trans isomerase